MQTRASAENLFTEEMRAAIREAIEPLSLQLAALTTSNSALTQQVQALESKLAQRDAAFLELDSENGKLQERIEVLEEAHDSLEQHGRRMNFRVQNIPFNEGESNESLQKQVLAVLKDAGAEIDSRDIVRLHRSTALQARENVCGGRRCSQVIVRVGRWCARESAHMARNRAREKGHAIRQDLTKRRRDMIASAQETISGWGELRGEPIWVYANINCQTVIRQGRDVRRFSTPSELEAALAHFKPH